MILTPDVSWLTLECEKIYSHTWLPKKTTYRKNYIGIYAFWRTVIRHDTLYVSMYTPHCNQVYIN